MKSLVALTTLFLLVMLCGCGAPLPSEHDAEQLIRQDIKKNNHAVRLLRFHKTNGQKSVENGVEHYRLGYEAEFEFTKDCQDQPWNEVNSYGEAAANQEINSYKGAEGIWAPVTKKGAKVKTLGRVKFEKTENGWRPSL